MSERRLQLSDIERFAYGEADELEEVIFSDPEYLAALEEIWASELPGDLAGAVVTAIHVEKFISGTLGLALDTALGAGRAFMHYLAGPIVDDTEERPADEG